jgi:hypothetical protein
MFFLKLLELKIEVRLSNQLTLLLYVVLFVVDGLLIKPLIIIIIILVLIVIEVGHDRLASLPNTYYQISLYSDGVQGQSFATASAGVMIRGRFLLRTGGKSRTLSVMI